MKIKKLLSVNLIFVIILSLCSCKFTYTKTDNTSSYEITENISQDITELESDLSEISETAAVTTAEKAEKTTQENSKTTQKTSAKTSDVTSAKSTAVTEKTKHSESKKQITCFVEISCVNILNSKDRLKENKLPFLPESGIILSRVKVKIDEGGTAFDALKKACAENVCTDSCQYCRKNGIQLDYVYTPGYDNYYIRGIHQLYEKDCGSQSGWMYSVGGVFPNFGCSEYKVKDGDEIKFLYTCNLGEDLGAEQ